MPMETTWTRALAPRLLEIFAPAAAEKQAPVWLRVRFWPDGGDGEPGDGGDGEDAQPEAVPGSLDPRTATVEWEVLPDPAGWFGRHLESGWDAAAVVATGRMVPVDPRHEMPADLAVARTGGVRLACVVPRSGDIGWTIALPGGSTMDEAPTDGLVLDTLLRAAGRPTPPPDVPIAELVGVAWAGAALARARSRPGRRLTWTELVRCHPLHPGMSLDDPSDCVRRLRRGAGILDWEGLRLSAARAGALDATTLRDIIEGRPANVLPGNLGCAPRAGRHPSRAGQPAALPAATGPAGPPPPALAGWMDEGMFSRWVLSAYPPLDDLLGEVRPLVTTDAYHHLRRTVGRRLSEYRLPRTYVR